MKVQRRFAALAILCVGSLTACGSTVHLTGSQQQLAESLGDGLSGVPSTATTPATDTSSAPGALPSVTGASSPTGLPSSTPSSDAYAAASGPGPISVSTGNKPLKVGLMYSTTTNAALSGIGANTKVPDGKAVGNALIAYVNSHGGLAGHPLTASYYNVNATDTPSAISQKACAQWTQDDHVFAAIPATSVEDNSLLRTCLGKANVIGIYPNFYSETQEADFRQSPLWFEPETLSLEQWATTYPAGLAAQGFFKGAKVGVVYDDGPAFTRVFNGTLLPQLKADGANVVSTFADSIRSAGDLSSASSQMANAVLKFRAAGVTHVLFYEAWQGWAFFTLNAQQEGWHPHYGLSTQEALEIMIESGLVSKPQLVGSTLISWNPSVDLRPANAGTWARKQLCLQIMTKAGLAPGEGDAEGYHGVLAMCSALLLLQQAARSAAQPLSALSIADSLQRIGSLGLATLPHATFTPGRRYGAIEWRPGAYSDSCTCFTYTGPAHTI